MVTCVNSTTARTAHPYIGPALPPPPLAVKPCIFSIVINAFSVRRGKKTLRQKWKRYWVNDGPKAVWAAVWLALNIALFTYTFVGTYSTNLLLY